MLPFSVDPYQLQQLIQQQQGQHMQQQPGQFPIYQGYDQQGQAGQQGAPTLH